MKAMSFFTTKNIIPMTGRHMDLHCIEITCSLIDIDLRLLFIMSHIFSGCDGTCSQDGSQSGMKSTALLYDGSFAKTST